MVDTSVSLSYRNVPKLSPVSLIRQGNFHEFILFIYLKTYFIQGVYSVWLIAHTALP